MGGQNGRDKGYVREIYWRPTRFLFSHSIKIETPSWSAMPLMVGMRSTLQGIPLDKHADMSPPEGPNIIANLDRPSVWLTCSRDVNPRHLRVENTFLIYSYSFIEDAEMVLHRVIRK